AGAGREPGGAGGGAAGAAGDKAGQSAASGDAVSGDAVSGDAVSGDAASDDTASSDTVSAEGAGGAGGSAAAGDGQGRKAPAPVTVDLAGLADRIAALPVPESRYSSLRAVKGGLAWLCEPLAGGLGEGGARLGESRPRPALQRFDFARQSVTV